MNQILLPAVLTRFNRKVDGTASLSFNTQEVGSEAFQQFAELHGKFGWIAFRESETEVPEMPDDDPERNEGKSLSQRLTAVLYVRWRQLTDKKECDEAFNDYRARVMESLIEKIKNKLD